MSSRIGIRKILLFGGSRGRSPIHLWAKLIQYPAPWRIHHRLDTFLRVQRARIWHFFDINTWMKDGEGRRGTAQPGDWGHALPALLLIVVTAALYWPAMHGGFLWDDDSHISTNHALRSLRGLSDIWFKPGTTVQYYPLTFTVFWVGYHLWSCCTEQHKTPSSVGQRSGGS